MGPCMCGDPYCPSCGPAQGNSRCCHCGAYSMDGGCGDPEACAKEDAKAAEALAEYFDWVDDHEEEIAAAIRAS